MRNGHYPMIKTLLLAALRAYKLGISPYLGQRCRFFPSCSEYAAEAISRHGIRKGGILAARRLGRCHPWHRGGFDPVPTTALSREPTAQASDCACRDH
jgi:putative membrane protein insertion efficiency factor